MEVSRSAALAAGLCISLSGIGVSQAQSLDFGILATTPGSLSFDGGITPLVGTDIEVDVITGIDTPLNSGNLNELVCTGCVLNFTTGAHTGGWNFNGGGTITVTGTTNPTGFTTLLSGTFENALVVDVGGGFFNFKIAGSSFTDTKDTDLLNYFGLPTTVDYIGAMNLSFSTINVPTAPSVGDAFTSEELFSGDIVNTPVPVPPAVWLFGSGLLGLVGIARRRRS